MNAVKTAEYLAAILPAPWPSSLGGHTTPSIEHSVGIGKLLGSDYGEALSDAFGISENEFVEQLTLLCSLMRAFIVIDDFARDHGLAATADRVIDSTKEAIVDDIKCRIAALSSNPEALWSKYVAQYEDACAEFPRMSPYSAVGSKCAMVFLPFELDAIRGSPRLSSVRETLADYLFALQLLDDFRDMAEDQEQLVNHNLFLLQTDEAVWCPTGRAKGI